MDTVHVEEIVWREEEKKREQRDRQTFSSKIFRIYLTMVTSSCLLDGRSPSTT